MLYKKSKVLLYFLYTESVQCFIKMYIFLCFLKGETLTQFIKKSMNFSYILSNRNYNTLYKNI